jgi:glutamine synthetase
MTLKTDHEGAPRAFSERERSLAAREEPAGVTGGALPACLLERLIARPACDWTVDDLIELVRERGIRVVSLMHVGGDGWLKTLDFVPRDLVHLRDILTGGERADGSSLFGGLGIPVDASDVVLRPRVASAFLDPFAPLPTLVVLCGHAGRDGQPLPQSPDTIVHRAYRRLHAETGADLQALGEVEFFLGQRAGELDVYGADDRGYHAASPFVFGEGLRRRALATLAEIGVPVKYGHAEVGYIRSPETDGIVWEQHEIELSLAPLPVAADAVTLTQWVVRNLARQDGLRCTFEPILREGHAGTGMHFHLSPVVDGEHVEVRGEEGRLSEPAQWLIAGLVRFGGALMAFGNRSEGSFVRLTQAKEAPSAIVWGDFDRSALVRLPVVARTSEGRLVSPPTIEFRLPDGSAHPHLLLAGVAQAMAQGTEMADRGVLLEKTAATAPDARTSALARIPRSFAEIADALLRHRQVLERGGVFPPALIDQAVQRMRG